MTRKVIIATHGKLAKGYLDALSILTGGTDQITAISSFTEDNNPKETIAQMMEQIPKDTEILVFTDIMGGSVNQMFIPYLESKNMHLITGINLALVVQILLREEKLTPQQILEDIELAKSEIKYVNQEIANYSKGSQETDETFFA